MPSFAYTARSDGQLVDGVRRAESASALADQLSEDGLLPVRIEEQAAAEKANAFTEFSLFKSRVSLAEVIVFSHQMASLSQAGISIVRAVRVLAESAKNQTLRGVLEDVAQNLESGTNLATSLGRHVDIFDELYISLVHVGENTGRLDMAFRRIASYLELERETRRRISSATRYPMFVVITMAIAVIILNVFVIPAFAGVFAKYGADLPWQTQAIIGVSNFFVAYWPYLLVAFAGGGYWFYRYVRTPDGRHQWDALKLRIPILGPVFERIYLGRFCQTFAMVSRAGVPLVQGLNIIARSIGNEAMARKVIGMQEKIRGGEGITTTAKQAEIFSPVVLQMMSVGEETGAMDDLLEQAAGFYEDEVEYELKGLTDAIEPILIVGIAVLVLIMALGVFLPLWDLNSVAN